jgi:hypothetical protein
MAAFNLRPGARHGLHRDMQTTAAVPDPKTRPVGSSSSYGSSSAATQLPRASIPRCTHHCTAAPLQGCKAAPASPGRQTPLAHPLAGQPAGAGKP